MSNASTTTMFANGEADFLPEASWSGLVPAEQWDVFLSGAAAMQRAGASFLLHGAMALATYTGRWRNTKDVDIIVRPEDQRRAVEALRSAAFDDYYEQEPYDRSWIFRGIREGVLFDIIWELPNHRVQIDRAWFERARPVRLRGRIYAIVPPEELIRVKLYVLQRERCDWVDVLNVFAGATEQIDWEWLIARMGRDVGLLQGALSIFNWMCPGRAELLPKEVRDRFALPMGEVSDPAAAEERRVRLFDSRPWFAAHQPEDQVLER
jgi:hypothetical protein